MNNIPKAMQKTGRERRGKQSLLLASQAQAGKQEERVWRPDCG